MSKKITDFFTKIPKQSKKDENNNHVEKDVINISLKEAKSTNDQSLKETLNISEKKKKSISAKSNSSNEDDKKTKSFKRIRMIDSSDESEEEKVMKKPKHNEQKNVFEEKERKETIKKSFLKNSTKIEELKTDDPVKKLLGKFSNQSNNKNEEIPEENEVKTIEQTNESFDHENYSFLKPESIRDSQGRRPTDPDYDHTSLRVPQDFMNKLTPAMKQWWQIKINGHWDVVLFFKVGKFYETYHQDAVTCVNELSLSFMKGNFAHSGFPETAFIKMADQLVLKGYKVARVEQTESVTDMEKRTQGGPSKEKVVRREICQILTPGTRTFSLNNELCKGKTHISGSTADSSSDAGFINDCEVDLLFAVKESSITASSVQGTTDHYNVEIGVAFVDTATAKFTLCQFRDDSHRSRLKTIFAKFQPTEIVYEKGNLSKDTQFVFNSNLAAIKKEGLVKKKQFLETDDTLNKLYDNNYFTETCSSKLSQYGLPIGLSECLNKSDNLGRTASVNYQLAINSLGGLLYYLEKCLIDKYLISHGEFDIFKLDWTKDNNEGNIKSHEIAQKYMILDSITMNNLDILINSSTGTSEGTLLECLDFTTTAFGKRLLVQWISNPLYELGAIENRQDAIKNLVKIDKDLITLKSKLKSLPDLEKLLAKIHILGIRKSVESHPDSRAVLYEATTYSKRKISDFVSALNGFKIIVQIQEILDQLIDSSDITSGLLQDLHESCNAKEIESKLSYFVHAFNHEEAKSKGQIIPDRGAEIEYDNACDEVGRILDLLEKYRNRQKTIINANIVYFGTGKNRYQMEIAESHCHKVPSEFEATSQRKGFKRYQSPETVSLLSQLILAEEQRDLLLKHIMSKIFSRFDDSYFLWWQAVKMTSELDVLISLATYSKGLDNANIVFPTFVKTDNCINAQLSITEGIYPCKTNRAFIPNSIKLGVDVCSSLMLLTGPNMGGKSTLMRQVGLTCILAQLGVCVPSYGPVVLNPVDRILTRQGAQDSLANGQSTLYVELSETRHLLQQMTRHSLLLIDELGRGTATHDGSALAYGILRYLVDDSATPRCIFSTHFHRLLDDTALISKLQIAHMACVVDDDDDVADQKQGNSTDENYQLQSITFLYKLVAGGCPKSYGFNAAKLANIPNQIIIKGMSIARKFEEDTLIAEFKRYLKTHSDINIACKDPEFILWRNKFRKFYNLG